MDIRKHSLISTCWYKRIGKYNELKVPCKFLFIELYALKWRRKWQPTPVFLSGESRGQRSLVGYSPRGHKESDTTEPLTLSLSGASLVAQTVMNESACNAGTVGDSSLIPGQEDPLKEGMATHSGILA